MKTQQEVFDYVVTHLFTQGTASVDRFNSMCTYRDWTGKMCAVGCLIPDHIYSEEIEGMGVHNLVRRFNDKLPGEISEYVDMLSELQDVHDRLMPRFSLTVGTPEEDKKLHYEEMLSVSRNLAKIAQSYNLKYNPPENYQLPPQFND